MAQKIRKWEEWLTLVGETARVISYADYYTRRPLFSSLQVRNSAGEEAQGLTLTLTNENGMLIPYEKQLEEIPFESVVAIDTGNVLSPTYFSGLEEIREEKVVAELKKDKKVLATAEFTVTALPFEYWQGIDGDLTLLASFVRPRLADYGKIRAEVVGQLKKWDVTCDLDGYAGNDKNTVRRIIAAVYSAIRKLSLERDDTTDIALPVSTGKSVKLVSADKVSALETALFTCGCLENLGLHPVLVLGEKQVTCGVWLYDSCFMDTVSDDMEKLLAYVSDGINNISCFDVEDLFVDKNASYSTSELHFRQKMEDGAYFERLVDVRRCRLSNIMPLPMRAQGVKGYEILTEESSSPDAKPSQLFDKELLKLKGEQTKDKQWERRLLDLSMKNTLLHFQTGKAVLHLATGDLDDALAQFSANKETYLLPANNDLSKLATGEKFGVSSKIRSMRELIEVENRSSVARVYTDEMTLTETAAKLIRKNKEADEESGTKILYLALGFLRWFTREDGAEHFAPLVLQPVVLKKSKGGVGYSMVVSDEEFSVNSTLLEYLKQEFNIDMRGLENASQNLKIAEILAMVRMEVMRMRRWEVFDDAYLSAFSFARYQMWYDLRQNKNEFTKHEIVSAFLKNATNAESYSQPLDEDCSRPEKTLTPLFADASQWEAIASSQLGKSFVLHGPPGTGKSQTITNIIANALYEGKRVLFVAEKQAALSVVKKRLDSLGLGDFCLELHSNKTNKADVLQKLTNTLALAGEGESVALTEKGSSIVKVRDELAAPMDALHKKRRLGLSVYEALLKCLQYKNAPDIMNIETTFYDGLTKENVEEYENMMITAAAAAKECGGVHNSPFSNVNLTEYSLNVRDKVYCAAEVMLAEIKHLKNYMAMFLEQYRQKISTLTRTKLSALLWVVKTLNSGALHKYFTQDEHDFHVFFNANRRLDACLERYFKRYKKFVKVGNDYRELSTWLEEEHKDIETNRVAKNVYKKLSKVAIERYSEDELVKDMGLLCEICEAMDTVSNTTKLSQYFTFVFGGVDYFDARTNFLKDLYTMHEKCAALFMDYNADSFNSMWLRADGGCALPMHDGLIRAIEGFYNAEDLFNDITKADNNKRPEENVLGYYTAKAGALIENIDMLASWCMYKKTASALDKAGLTFITQALENGDVTGENIVASFEKNIYKNFLQTNLPLDPVLSQFSAGVCEEKAEVLRLAMDEFAELTKSAIRAKLISRLPTSTTESSLSLEVANFARLSKSNLRGTGLRKLFEEIPELIKVLAPCMLMSPVTVSQYLAAQNGLFDMVVFDEASQIPTADAICSIARGKCAIIVGDPKQLPPTSFFHTNYVDEDNLENEDMESLLDECLAINMPQRHLTWHYRSKHESLIAFSNAMYYENRLCTFPSPDALNTKVSLRFIEDGLYDRGLSKRNKQEGDALVDEVIRRLTTPSLQKSSIGIVTFSSVQKDYIERKLTERITEKRLEREAYDREEPLFVKNLENVQGDERDVIFFSVCYGPDRRGKISLNFGPLNQAGGWRRLNVAVSRAREEMVVFSSMTGAMIDLSKTNSKGVIGLKAFLDFAEKGRTNLAIASGDVIAKKTGLGKYIAKELAAYGYDCRYDVGVSGFKIDVAVVDPRDKQRFILAVMCDTPAPFSTKDRNVLQIQTLKRNNWNVVRLFSVNYYNNPKREIKKIKDVLDKLTGADKKGGAELHRAKKDYKYAAIEPLNETAVYVTSGENDKEIIARLKQIVQVEEPISCEFLIRRVLSGLGIYKYGSKVEARMQALIALCGFKSDEALGETFYYKTDKKLSFDKYRVENEEPLRKGEFDYTPYEIVAIARSALEDKVALYMDEVRTIIASVLQIAKPSEKFSAYVNECIAYGEKKGLFVRSVADRITLA